MTTDVKSLNGLRKSRPTKSKPPKVTAVIFVIVAVFVVVAGVTWSATIITFAAPEIVAAATVGTALIFASAYFLYTKVVFTWITNRVQLEQDIKRLSGEIKSLAQKIEKLK